MNPKCPHEQNPKACLQCFHAPKPRAQPATPRENPVPQNALGAPMVPLPGTKAPPRIGDRTGAQVGVAVCGQPPATPEERARHRGENKPKAPPPTQQQPKREPYSYERQDGAEFSTDRQWEPPEYEELIDRLPTHPSAGR
jgi:hypothetical protein